MSFLFDNLAATFIALVLVVLLISMQFRVQAVSADRTALYSAKKQTLEFADLLTRELSNIGAQMPKGKRIGKRTQNEHGHTDTLSFWRVDSSTDTLKIDYVLVPVDTLVRHDTTSTIMYQVRRYQDGAERGGSPPTLSDFELTLLDQEGNETANMDEVRQVRIYLSTMLPFGDPDDYYLPQVYWGTTLRPNSLR